MKRSARSRRSRAGFGGLLMEGVAMTASAALRNPMAVGGTTAFLVTLAYVSANAVWYQPHAHRGAYFATRVLVDTGPLPAPERFVAPARQEQPHDMPAARPVPDPEPDGAAVLVERQTTASLPTGDPRVRLVQEVLGTLDLYTGEVDGLAGPQTSKAVEHYQKIVGLPVNGRIDDELLRQLGAGGATPAPAANATQGASLPVSAPVPKPKTVAAVSSGGAAEARPVARASDPVIMRIQAGLRAFGHDAIELDGVVGARTRAAILEFQSLFGLPQTGQPDAGLYAKMREIGLTD